MSRKTRKTKIIQRKIAEGRLKILFDSADAEALNGNFELANRHVELTTKDNLNLLEIYFEPEFN